MDGEEFPIYKINGEGVYIVHKKSKMILKGTPRSPETEKTVDDSESESPCSLSSVLIPAKRRESGGFDEVSKKKMKVKGHKVEVLSDKFICADTLTTVVDESMPVAPAQFSRGAKDNNQPLPEELTGPPQDMNCDMFPGVSNDGCEHCRMIGVFCHNKRYGRYCILAAIRYRRTAKEKYTEEGAKQAFIQAYAYCSDFEHFLANCAVPLKMKTKVPYCMEKSSLAIAMVSNSWNHFIHGFDKQVV